ENSLGDVLIGGAPKGGDGVIGAIAPVNAMGETYTLTYGESGAGAQSPARFAHKKPQTLQAFIHNKWEPVAFVGQFKLELEGQWELRAR
ncbi:MAG TPA: hypothetical protein VMG62_03395, partial [Solirubrobacteraceae bacterium]|nr:hypothetical protein [Solirubrobacteraceae bacterium]